MPTTSKSHHIRLMRVCSLTLSPVFPVLAHHSQPAARRQISFNPCLRVCVFVCVRACACVCVPELWMPRSTIPDHLPACLHQTFWTRSWVARPGMMHESDRILKVCLFLTSGDVHTPHSLVVLLPPKHTIQYPPTPLHSYTL